MTFALFNRFTIYFLAILLNYCHVSVCLLYNFSTHRGKVLFSMCCRKWTYFQFFCLKCWMFEVECAQERLRSICSLTLKRDMDLNVRFHSFIVGNHGHWSLHTPFREASSLQLISLLSSWLQPNGSFQVRNDNFIILPKSLPSFHNPS